MVHCYGLRSIALLVACIGTFVHAEPSTNKRYMGKRDPNRDYYTLNIPTEEAESQLSGFKSAQYIAHQLGVRLEGNVGELKNWYMVSSEKSTLGKRGLEQDRVLSTFARYKSTSHLNKRDGDGHQHWQKVNSIDKQVAKRRTKRGPIPREPVFNVNDEMADAQKTLSIADPWFNQQWHLVSLFYLFYDKKER